MGQPIKIIGVTESGIASLPQQYREWIEESEQLVGGERLLDFFPSYKGEKIVVKSGLSKMVETLQQTSKKTVVLASGDPLFFGIGGYLAKKINVEIYPNISSLQQAFAKMKESWHDCFFVSVHGRNIKGLAQKIDGHEKVCLLTDETNTPKAIASYLLEFGMDEYEAFIAEAVGGESEKTTFMTLSDMMSYDAHPLNVVILKQKNQRKRWTLGIPDAEFSQRKPDKGLITKKEIRVLSIGELNLHKKSTVWDIGTCTGSMAIEAARIAKEGQVFAIEKNESDLQNCYENMKKFQADITAICGKAPARLNEFPDPDAIFIGGTGGEMKELLSVCASRLKPHGRLVLNAATIETLYEATEILKQLKLKVSITLAQISRSKPILHMTRFEGLNPVYIITAAKEEE